MPTSPVYTQDLSYKIRDLTPGFDILQASKAKAGSIFKRTGKPITDSPFIYYDRVATRPSCAINHGGGYSASETAFTVDTEVGTFKAGDIAVFKDANIESAVVVSHTGHVLATEAVAHAHADDVEIIWGGSLNSERSTGNEGTFVDGDPRTNYCRILRCDAKLGEIAAASRSEAFNGDRMTDYMAQALETCWDDFNLACLFGKPVAQSSSVSGNTSGLFYYLNDATYSARVNGGGDKLTYTDIKNLIKLIDQRSSTDPDVLIGNINVADIVSQMNTELTNATIFIGQDAITAGLPGASAVYSGLPGHGAKRFIVDNNVPDTFLLMCNSNFLEYEWLTGFELGEYDAMRKDVPGPWRYAHGVFGTKIRNPYICHGLVYGFTLV